MNFRERLARALMGGPLDELPEEGPVRPGFGLEDASIEGSDVLDQLRNAERKEGAIPVGPGAMASRFAGVRGFLGRERLNPQSQTIQRLASEFEGTPTSALTREMQGLRKKAEISKMLEWLQSMGPMGR